MITEEKEYSELEARGPLQVKNRIVGILKEGRDGTGVVVPDVTFKEGNIGNIKIERNYMNGAPIGMVVVVEILNPAANKGEYRGKILEVLGSVEENDIRIKAIVRQYGLSLNFPDEVLSEVKDLPTNPTEKEVDDEISNGRKDLRKLLTITIDGEEAKDLDDAISLEKLEDGNYKLYVHIADVSHYVKANTKLDDEALNRATSVYLVDRVIPMLPPKLSNGLCSLNPNADRLTLTVEMNIDKLTGDIYEGAIYESVINSNRRMSYNECYGILFEEKPLEDNPKIKEMLIKMKVLTDILKRKRNALGALNFEFPETRVIFDDEGNVSDVMPYPINYCHGMIEEFMISANEFVAQTYSDKNYPFVYRIHEQPDPIKLSRFIKFARQFGATGNVKNNASVLEIRNYTDTIKNEECKSVINLFLLRALAKARYSPDNMGHYGLASKYYCHFTSPIRRYPDLYIHRIIKSEIHHENKRKYFLNKVDNVSTHSSDMERNAIEAERASVDSKVALYMHDKVGEEFSAIISSIIANGMFVMLDNSIEGFVAFRNLKDHYFYDERYIRAVGKRTGNIYTIGKKVDVVLASVDTTNNHIDFELKEESNNVFFNRPANLRNLRIKSKENERKAGRRKRRRGKRK